VGFIGLGDQGLPMATAIARAGFSLHTWARRPASSCGQDGVPHQRHDAVRDLGTACDVVCLCVPTDDDVRQLTVDLLEGLRPGSTLVNHGTGLPTNAVRFTEMCAAGGVDVLDAPVSGGRPAAEARRLTTLVGGAQSAARRCEPIFAAFSDHVVHLRPTGAGQTAKLFNNALLMMNQAAIAEIVDTAAELTLDIPHLVQALTLGSASSAAMDAAGVDAHASPRVA